MRTVWIYMLVTLLPVTAFAHGTTSPTQHAPAGVMLEHAHDADEWMFGYRYLYESQSGLMQGDESISLAGAGMAGFSMAPVSMTMQMHMFDIMYAPSDTVTLMLMPQYMQMDMAMEMTGAMGHGGHGGMSMTGSHAHDVSGLGDTVLAGLFRVLHTGNHQLLLTIGLSVPTGAVDIKTPDGAFTHYGMQLGSGTWDLLPGIVYTGNAGTWSWGMQLAGTRRLQNENDSGFSFGDIFMASSWAALRLNQWSSISGRLGYRTQGQVEGHYNGAHQHSSPPDLQGNYGGERLEVGLGMNFLIPSGQRFGIEMTYPIHEDYNGIQLANEYTVHANWSIGFQ